MAARLRNTLDRVYRGPKVYTGRSEGADVSSHLTEIIDGLIRISVQFIQNPIHLLQICSLVGCIGQNSLDRTVSGFHIPENRF